MANSTIMRLFRSAFLILSLFLFVNGQTLAQENGNDNGNGNGDGDANGDPSPELVNINGNFEDADLGPVEDLTGIPGWVLELGGNADADYEIVEGETFEGEKSLKITVNDVGTNAWDIQVVGDSIQVEPGASYHMSVWMKAENDGPVDVTVGNYAFNEYARSSEDLVAGEWTQYELDFTITDQETVIRAPFHFSFAGNAGNVIHVDHLEVTMTEEAPARRMPVVVGIAEGVVGESFDTGYHVVEEDTTRYVYITEDGWDIADPSDDNWSDIWAKPISEEHVVTLDVTFPYAGEYNMFMRGRVGPGESDDDSFFYPVDFGEMDVTDDSLWTVANQLDFAGYADPDAFVLEGGAAGAEVWKWLNISEGNYHDDSYTFTVPSDDTTLTFQIGGRETDFDMDKIAFGRSDLFYTVGMLDNAEAGLYEITEDPIVTHPGPPLAEGLDKFLGNIYANTQLTDFENYWNQVTPENASKWGHVESTRGQYNWSTLDAAYDLAKDNEWPFRFHVLVWGNQQPAWMPDLVDRPEEQLEAVELWMEAVAERYPDLDYVEVVNEPLHDPPDEDPDNAGAGNYVEALGGTGETGWDWVITAFEMARDIFPEETILMINEYGILGNMGNAQDYREIIELLQERDLIDAIGVQGHAFSTRGSAEGIIEVLDYLGETGLPIQVTEMDMDGNPNQSPNITQEQSDQNQLETMQRVFPAVWEHPSVEGVTKWGWRPGLWRQGQEAYLIRSSGEERPAMKWLIDYMEDYQTRPTSVDEFAGEEPNTFRLYSNYPNPFNPVTQIRYEIAEQVDVTLKVYDITGRLVQTLVNNVTQSPGLHTVNFDAGSLASGVYLYRLQAGSFRDVQQMMLVK